MLVPAVVLEADLPLGEVGSRLEPFAADVPVVVVVDRLDGRELHVLSVADVADTVSRAPPASSIAVALNLQPSLAADVVELRDGAPPPGPAVLVDGDRVLGVLVPQRAAAGQEGRGSDDDVRGGGASDDEVVGAGLLILTDHVQYEREDPAEGLLLGDRPPPTPWDADAAVAVPGGAGGASPQPGETLVRPHLDAPAEVSVGERFDLSVSLRRPSGPADPDALAVPTADERFDLVVQVVAPGFRLLGDIRHVLHVEAGAPEGERATFALAAEDVGRPKRLRLDVELSYAGVLCGRAWREVVVLPAGATAPAATRAPRAGSAPLLTGPAPAPDLTVTITEVEHSGRFTWAFTTPHAGVTLPEEPVTTSLPGDSGQTFAAKLIRSFKASDALVDDAVRGAGVRLARALPRQFFVVLGAVWERVRQEGRVPTLLIVTSDPYTPWELALLSEEHVDPALLDDERPAQLCAQAAVGRWPLPTPSARGHERPRQPPLAELTVREVAVVVGDYANQRGWRDLPEAREEARQLARRYRAVTLAGTVEDLDPLLGDTLERDGARVAPDLVHFACHGERNPDHPELDGIILDDERRRLDELTVAGSRLGAERAPFAFLNACQVGTAGEDLGQYAGLPGAFVIEGFCGLVAPLWSVGDATAREVALDFYTSTLDADPPVPVAEALREMRRRYRDHPLDTTPLAYVFYGHPQLVLHHQAGD